MKEISYSREKTLELYKEITYLRELVWILRNRVSELEEEIAEDRAQRRMKAWGYI
ncbi:hypothetical protein J7J18_04360 [bacterium]|nr:hypothetical protein [bacterium]